MAIYHLSVKFISRSSGRSAPSAAAYRSGERIYDERKDRVFNYPGKSKQVLFSEILTPSGAPEWMKDREKLWNAVEACENRKDSQVAKELELALPKELSLSENIQLLKEFVSEQFVKEGLVVDANIHDQDRGNENIHAHVMLTTRRVVGNGFDLKKAVDLNKKEVLLGYREEWANKVNQHLSLNGHNIQIDHRSYEDQGIGLKPQNKRGPKFTRKRLVEKTQEHLEIAKENGEKIYDDPKIALCALSRQQSTFSKQDIARFVNRHTVDQEQFTRVFDRVYNSAELVLLGLDQKGQERYSLREMVRLEKEMLDTAKILSESYTHDVGNPSHDRISMAVSRAGKNIREVFVKEEKKLVGYSNLSDEQKLAVEHITKGNDLTCVLGYAGTGKSYMLGAAKEIWEEQGYRVRGLSLTGIAAQGLTDGSGIKSQTVARQFLNWKNGRDRISERDIVVLDEVGMVASREFHSILSYTKEAGAKLVITGDFNQLPPIGAGAAARSVMEKIGYAELTEVRRQKEEWQQEATKQLARGEIEAAIDSYYKKGHVHIEHKYRSAQDQIIEKWARNLTDHPDKNQIMAAFTNEEVRQLNLKARDIASELGVLGSEEHEVAAASGKLAMAEHEKILFLKNSNDLGVMNGMLGEISAINQNKISVVINKFKENQQEITFSTDEYNHFTYGYAATVHKLQGATFDNVQVLASKYFNKNLAYVAFTRHREELDIYHSFSNNAELIKVVSRDASKDTTLDYEQISKEILNYQEIQPLGDLGYMAFHHRELVKELELIGDKGVSFCTGKQERGLVAGLIEHNHKQYVVLEQEKEFKLYNQNAFYHNDKQELGNDEQELINSIGCFVTVNKNWNEANKSFNVELHNSGLSLLDEALVSKEQSVFVLGKGVDALQKEIITLESKYQKPANFLMQENIYGIYRGSASIGDKEYGLVETATELKVLTKENFTEIEKDKWIAVKENYQAVVIRQEEAPSEYIFDLNQTKEHLNISVYETADIKSSQTAVICEAAELKIESPNQVSVESHDIEEIRKMLAYSSESIIEEVLGRPNERLSSASEWRYGNKGSLAISIGGDKKGVWYDFESGDSGDLIGLIQKKTGMSFPETLKFVSTRFGSAQYIRLPDHKNIVDKNDHVKNEQHVDSDISKDKTSKYAEKLAAESLPIAGTIVETYLKEVRGIQSITGVDIRYHPQVFTGKEEVQKYMPAMLSLARDKDGKVQCVQATYLDPKTASKADLAINKRTYASPSGALVFLQKHDEVTSNKTSYIAEGIETGLSIKDAVENGEVAVTLGKSNFAKIEPQSVGQNVVFCLDNDGSNIHTDVTIHKAAERLLGFGKEVFIAVPKQIEIDGQLQKTDFNDISRTYGIDEVKSSLDQAVSYGEWSNGIDPENKIEQKEVIQEAQKIAAIDKGFIEREISEKEQGGNEQEQEVEAQAESVVTEPFNAKMDKIVKDCTAFVDSYDYHKINLDKLLSSGGESPYLRGEISESAKGLKQYLKANCNDKDTLIYFRDHEKRLFNGMDTICKNVLSNTLKDFEAHDKLRSLVQDRPGLYERVVTTERQYKIFSIKLLEASKQTQIANHISYDETTKYFRIEKGIREQFDRYAHHIAKDAEVTKIISTYNPVLFKHMDKQFDGMFTEALVENEHREAYINKHPEFDKNRPKEKRFLTIVDQYGDLRRDFNIKQQLTEKASNGNDYTETKKYLRIEMAAKKEFEEYTNAICQDIEMAKMIRNEATFMFNDINEHFNNKLANILSENALHEQFIQSHPELGKNTSPDDKKLDTVMEQYKELKEVYLESCQAQEAFKDSNPDEYNKHVGIAETAEDDLNRYAHEACQDKELMDQVKNQDEQMYNEMQEKYNEIEQENFERMQELQKELER